MMNTALLGEAAASAASSCLTGVRVKEQYCHLEVNLVLALEYLHVIIRVLFILNIAVIANTGISSHTKLTRYR